MNRVDWNEAEMLLALWHLRYLTTEQINRFSYGRSPGGCVKRLSRLKKGGFLERVPLGDDAWRSAWRIGSEGLRHLRAVKDGEFAPTDPVSTKYVPHLLETNEVFLALSGEEKVWERLPFSWSSSHQVELRYRRLRLEPGMPQQAVIRPDAMVVTASRRVFVELDRSTECLSPKDGRRSITRKLEAYRQFLIGRAVDGRRWYEHAFPDGKAARVLFVLSKRDGRARDPANRDRRMRGVLGLSVEVFGRVDTPPVRVVYLDDALELAKVCRLEGGASALAARDVAVPIKTPALSSADVAVFERLFVFYNNLWQRLRHDSRTRGPARDTARVARERLTALAARRIEAPELQTMPGVPR